MKALLPALLSVFVCMGSSAWAQSEPEAQAGQALLPPSANVSDASAATASTSPVRAGTADAASLQPVEPVQPTAPVERPIHLPGSYRPAWPVDRSRLGDTLSYGFASLGSPRVLAEALVLTGIPDLPTAPPQPNAPYVVTIDSATTYENQMDAWGNAMDTWRRSSETVMRYHEHRLETAFATAETRMVFSNLVLPVALRQQARYRPAPIDAPFAERMTNAATSIVVTYDNHGRRVPNYSKLVGTVAAGFLGKSVYAREFHAPEFDSQHFVVKYVGYSLAGDLATNVAHELIRASTEQDVEVYRLNGRSSEDSYYPLSAGAKFLYWVRSTYAARTFAEALLLTGIPKIGTQPVQPAEGVIATDQEALTYDREFATFGTAIQSWRRNLEQNIRYHDHRLIGGMAAAETQMTIQNLAVPMLFGIDPRYIPLGAEYSAGARMNHAFTSLVSARTDSGGHTWNAPLLLGTIGGALLAKEVYYPQLDTPALATNRILATTIGLNLAADILGNLRSEFLRHRGY